MMSEKAPAENHQRATTKARPGATSSDSRAIKEKPSGGQTWAFRCLVVVRA